MSKKKKQVRLKKIAKLVRTAAAEWHGYLSPADLQLLLLAADILINLDYLD